MNDSSPGILIENHSSSLSASLLVVIIILGVKVREIWNGTKRNRTARFIMYETGPQKTEPERDVPFRSRTAGLRNGNVYFLMTPTVVTMYVFYPTK